MILDHWGIVKADVGVKEGRIHTIGKAGNPDTQSGVDIVIGPGTEIIAGEGTILTAGGIDAHIHFICPQQVEEALMSGVTTMIGGGTGPATGTKATTCTPGPWYLGKMLQSTDQLPMNLAFWARATPVCLMPCVNSWMPVPVASNCTKTGDHACIHRLLLECSGGIRRSGGNSYRYPERVRLC